MAVIQFSGNVPIQLGFTNKKNQDISEHKSHERDKLSIQPQEEKLKTHAGSQNSRSLDKQNEQYVAKHRVVQTSPDGSRKDIQTDLRGKTTYERPFLDDIQKTQNGASKKIINTKVDVRI